MKLDQYHTASNKSVGCSQ
uniref:Uncharacterized protein n=1 Tax=Anguilla anguilla TaxID=7936 RepID=A0A0E9PN63_ANGAN